MSTYTCQACGENLYPDSLFPIRIELPMVAGTQFFLVCKPCYTEISEKMAVEAVKFVDEFQEVQA